MNAGKSIEIIKVAHNYEEKGKNVLVLTSAIDDRYGIGKITSRVGVSRDAELVFDETNIMEIFLKHHKNKPVDCVLIDECQFLKKHHVEEIAEIVEERLERKNH